MLVFTTYVQWCIQTDQSKWVKWPNADKSMNIYNAMLLNYWRRVAINMCHAGAEFVCLVFKFDLDACGQAQYECGYK